MKRLFFALWPDDIIRNQCVKISHAIRLESARSVEPANLHATLLFLGNIDSDKELTFRQEAAAIPVPKITIQFDQLSFWQKPGILCLTAAKFSPELVMLVDNLSTIARKLDHPIDARPFKPHVTLVKKVKKLITLEFEPIIWHSEAFCLVESCSLTNGVEYRIIEQWKAI